MAYTKQVWQTGPGGGTPISAERLNYMETGISDAHDPAQEGARVASLINTNVEVQNALDGQLEPGPAGPANTLAVGTVTTGAAGSSASATITGTAPNQTLNLTIPRGNTGDAGTAATITSASATTLAPGSSATVTLGGTSSARTFTFGIPRGEKGDPGDVAGATWAGLPDKPAVIAAGATAAEARSIIGAGTGSSDLTLGTTSTTAAVGNHGHALTDSNITGILPLAQIPTGTTNATVALGGHTHTAAQTTSGTFAAARLPAATETAIGAVERATDAEAQAGTDTTRYVSPASLKSVLDTRVPTADPRLAKLYAGLRNSALDTRVVGLGSSTMGGAYTPVRSQEFFQRLAFRAGALSVGDVDTVSSAVSAGPMRWWQVTEGGTTAANYYPTARRTRVNYIKPDYVIHMVGSNDWANNVVPSTYQSNLSSAVAAVESANPGVINILVHQQPRKNPASTTYAWSAYATAMAAVAAANPSQRIFIDATENPMSMLDILGNDSWNIGSGDNIHMNERGHRILADAVGRVLGIPSETDLIRPYTFFTTLPASAVYEVGTTTLWSQTLPALAYPHYVSMEGVVFGRSGGAGQVSQITAVIGDFNVGSRLETTGNNIAVPVSYTRLRGAGVTTDLSLLMEVFNGNAYLSGSGNFSRVSVTVTPA